jgi:two-component system nitrate/nitrite response regulator NarL
MIRVYIVDEMQKLCELTAKILKRDKGVQIVATTTETNKALDCLSSEGQEGDIVVLSASIPENGGIKLLKRIEKDYPGVKVLVTGLPESEEEILRFIEAGAEGYTLRQSAPDELLEQLRAIDRGEFHVDPKFAARLLEHISVLSLLCDDLDFNKDGLLNLTPREIEVLSIIELNFTNPKIADALGIEVSTVKNHVHSILEKLGVDRRQDAATVFKRFKTHLH